MGAATLGIQIGALSEHRKDWCGSASQKATRFEESRDEHRSSVSWLWTVFRFHHRSLILFHPVVLAIPGTDRHKQHQSNRTQLVIVADHVGSRASRRTRPPRSSRSSWARGHSTVYGRSESAPEPEQETGGSRSSSAFPTGLPLPPSGTQSSRGSRGSGGSSGDGMMEETPSSRGSSHPFFQQHSREPSRSGSRLESPLGGDPDPEAPQLQPMKPTETSVILTEIEAQEAEILQAEPEEASSTLTSGTVTPQESVETPQEEVHEASPAEGRGASRRMEAISRPAAAETASVESQGALDQVTVVEEPEEEERPSGEGLEISADDLNIDDASPLTPADGGEDDDSPASVQEASLEQPKEQAVSDDVEVVEEKAEGELAGAEPGSVEVVSETTTKPAREFRQDEASVVGEKLGEAAEEPVERPEVTSKQRSEKASSKQGGGGRRRKKKKRR